MSAKILAIVALVGLIGSVHADIVVFADYPFTSGMESVDSNPDTSAGAVNDAGDVFRSGATDMLLLRRSDSPDSEPTIDSATD